MGDHRISIKCEIEFHGVKDTCDMWLNFSDGECEGVHQCLVDFARDVHRRGMDRWYDAESKRAMKDHRERIEAVEKAQLADLKAKYEGGKDE